MIHHKHKCIFIHINKCAGTSVSLAMDMLKVHITTELVFSDDILSDSQNTCWQGWLRDKALCHQYNWSPLDEVKDYWNEYFKFTIVRNPWDRIVSDLHFCKNRGIVDQNLTVKQDVIEHFDSNERWKSPCVDWITLNGENQMDMVLRFENLQHDFQILCDRLNINATLPYKNKSTHKHYTKYYDEETRELVAKKYAKDIEYFGYRFGEENESVT